MKKIFTQKNIIIAVMIFLIVGIALIAYRMFLEFNSKDVAIYIKEESDKYPASQQKVINELIKDGVEYILSSHNRTQQVLKSAKATGTPKEQVLVHVAIMECQSNGYLNLG